MIKKKQSIYLKFYDQNQKYSLLEQYWIKIYFMKK